MVEEKSNAYPKVVCEKCSVQMVVIGVGSASGRLNYQCPTCNATFWGKNLAAIQLGALGGKARAGALTETQRKEQARNAVEARWRKAKQT